MDYPMRSAPSQTKLTLPPFALFLLLFVVSFWRYATTTDTAAKVRRYELTMTTMRKHFAILSIFLLGVSLGVRAEDQGPVEKTGKTVEKAATKTGKTVEHAASATGQTIKHGTEATERTVGKGLKKTGNTLEKAGHATTGSSHHHHAKASPSPSPKSESKPLATPSPTPVVPASTPVPTPTPEAPSTPAATATPSR
jgi:hypothetical protein